MRNDGALQRRSYRPLAALAAFAVLSVIVAACGRGPTGYIEASDLWGSGYGYSDKPIGGDEHSIVVTGSPRTTKARMADIGLLRAARLSRDHARTHFVVLIQRADEVVRRDLVSAPVWIGALIQVPVAETAAVHEPHLVLIIRLLPNDGPRPENALDAAAIIAEVGLRLEKPPGS